MHVRMCVCTCMWVSYGTAMQEPDMIKKIKKIKSMHVHMCVCTYMWVLYGTAMEEPDIIKEIRTKI